MKRIIFIFVVATLISPFSAWFNSQTAEAISGWKAGNIIENAVMTNTSTMTRSQIQSFLNKKMPSCDTYGKQLSEYGGPDLNKDGKVQRWEWGKANYNQTKFVCLRDYVVGDGRSAAKVIYDVSKKYSINPQVLIVLLQKEQGLVQDTWPLKIQYKTATGYGCPDTAPCNSDYYGLVNQLDWAAKMFRAILNNSSSWYTPYVLGNNYIRYNPNSSCGGSTVNILNRATQALYNYTPYQPNKGALDAGWGTAPCGAYGNRNFYLYFTNWFGSTRKLRYQNMTTSRWMEVAQSSSRVDFTTMQPTGGMLAIGEQRYFKDKITIDGVLYLRTEYDSSHNIAKGIPYSDLKEVTLDYVPLTQQRWMETKTKLQKVDPVTRQKIGSEIPSGTQIYMPTKTTIGGITYIRTQNDTDAGKDFGIPLSDLADTDVEYVPFVKPRWMVATAKAYTTDLTSPSDPGVVVSQAGEHKFFRYKLSKNGKLYAQENLPASGTYPVIPLSSFEEINLSQAFRPMQTPRWMVTNSDNVFKKNPVTASSVGSSSFPQDTAIHFDEKVTIGGETYLRSSHDSRNKIPRAIKLSELAETPGGFSPLNYTKMVHPRDMKISANTYTKNLVSDSNYGPALSQGDVIKFNTKVMVGSTLYLRSSEYTSLGYSVGVPYSLLTNL